MCTVHAPWNSSLKRQRSLNWMLQLTERYPGDLFDQNISRSHDIPPFPIPFAVSQNHSCHGSSRHHFLITLPAPLDYILDLDLWCNTQVVILFSNLELDADSCTSRFDFGLLEWFGPPWISRLWGKHEVVILRVCVFNFSVSCQCDICHIWQGVRFTGMFGGGFSALKSTGFSRATFVFNPQNETWERTNGKKEPL